IGSTTTRIAVFRGKEELFRETLEHESQRGSRILEERTLRRQNIEDVLSSYEVSLERLDLFVSRGGLLRPVPSGIYRVNDAMCDDLVSGRFGEHASALGPLIAFELARKLGRDAITVDPPSTDEFSALARVSGLPDIPRTSAFHALNQKACARRVCREMGRAYEESCLVVAHMGGGTTVGAHLQGKVVDATHGLSEGPFTPERAGEMPTLQLIDYVLDRGFTREQARNLLVGGSGLIAHLGTGDAREVERRIASGDEKAWVIYRAMAYQVGKQIGAMAAVLGKNPDRIVLTGGLAVSEMFTTWICEMVGFLGRVRIYPGENEIEALMEAALTALEFPSQIREYPPA
ncbi:MAG: butyrate kinase, partial [Desulfomonilia bacterium]|nr:butyrate kinase [Desulfomonilia bacterium]